MDGKHEHSAAPNCLVFGNLWIFAGYFRAFRDSRPTASEMGKLVFYAGQPQVDHAVDRNGLPFLPAPKYRPHQ